MSEGMLAALAGMVLAGFATSWVGVAASTAIQRRTPPEVLGRVSGAFGLSLAVPQVLSVGLGAALIAVVSYRVLLAVIAVVVTVAAAYLASRPEIRRGPAQPAAAQADPAR
jgi:MFS family permease